MCKYCEGEMTGFPTINNDPSNISMTTIGNNTYLLIHDYNTISYKYVEINYCPICGRNFKENK
jgi:hypothetical protein